MYTVDVAKRPATYRIEPGLLAAVTVKAAERGETVTDMVVRAMEAYVRGDEAAGIVPVAPVSAVTVHTPVWEPESYDEPPAAPPCRHPVDRVDVDTGVCGECHEDVW